MENSVAAGAVRISLFQTVPGEELAVQGLLKDACKKARIKHYAFFKAFGTFDIALIYTTTTFADSIGRFGPIPSILKSNHLLCYSYKKQDAKSLLTSLKANNLIGVSLLKIDPLTQRAYPRIERELREYIIDREKNWLLLGSIGWNEIILIVEADNINTIVKELLEMSAVGYTNRNVPVLAKTLSFVCMNYECMPTLDVLEKGIDDIRNHLIKYPFLRDIKVGQNSRPSIEITAKPIYANSIKEYFRNQSFKGYDLLGKNDLLFEPSPKISWADCLSAVLHFRHHFRDKAFSTSTRLKFSLQQDSDPYSEKPWKVKCVDFSYRTLERGYGMRIATNLANHFYSFNSLIQNPLYGSAFVDMTNYPEHVLKTGEELGIMERLSLAHGAREVIRYGSELRLCGTFQSIEEETGKFSEIQGGGQRALLALEYLPHRVFERLGRTWNGFIVTSHYDKLMHVNEVIQVPTYTLWTPRLWWTLYHEMAHIWIDLSPEVVSFEVPVIQEFLVNNRDHRRWLGKLMELAAEVVGFELGFFGDYDLFFRCYWDHIASIDAAQRTMVDVGDYALRSFFTELFWRGFDDTSGSTRIAKKQLEDPDFTYVQFLKHIEKIESHFGRSLFPDKRFIAAEKAQWCSDLYGFAFHLASRIADYRLRPARRGLNSENTEAILRNLSMGKIWWDKISCPEAVVYRLLKLKSLNFRRSISTVITFWNQQVKVIKRRFL